MQLVEIAFHITQSSGPDEGLDFVPTSVSVTSVPVRRIGIQPPVYVTFAIGRRGQRGVTRGAAGRVRRLTGRTLAAAVGGLVAEAETDVFLQNHPKLWLAGRVQG